MLSFAGCYSWLLFGYTHLRWFYPDAEMLNHSPETYQFSVIYDMFMLWCVCLTMAIHLCAAKKKRSAIQHYQCTAVVTHCKLLRYILFCHVFFWPWMGTLKPFFGYTCSSPGATRTRYPSAECTWSSCDSSTRCFAEDGVNSEHPAGESAPHFGTARMLVLTCFNRVWIWF